nr:FCD domain-containing protein [Cytophagales bacterium]
MSIQEGNQKKHVEKIDIEPITNQTMTDQVEDRLRSFFRAQGFKPGDAIPKEMELAEALNVSRNIVREALSRLRMFGMVDSRKKRGMIIAEPDILSGIEKTMDTNLLGETMLKQLFEFRLVLEMGMGDLLFLRVTEKDLKKLDQIVLEEEEKAVSRIDHLKYEVDFHGMLYKITGNETLMRFQKMLMPVFQYTLKVSMGLDEKVRHGLVTHRDLVRLLREGDPDSFRKAIRNHFDPYFLLLTGGATRI